MKIHTNVFPIQLKIYISQKEPGHKHNSASIVEDEYNDITLTIMICLPLT